MRVWMRQLRQEEWKKTERNMTGVEKEIEEVGADRQAGIKM